MTKLIRIFRKVLRFIYPYAEIGYYKIRVDRRYKMDIWAREYPMFELALKELANSLSWLHKTGIIIDIGANTGDTIALLRSEGLNNEVYAFEGNRKYFNLLKQNALKLKNVKCFNQWLGIQINGRRYKVENLNGSSSLKQGKENIRLVKFDDLSIDNEILLFKTDTDGFDVNIITSALKTLNKFKPVIYTEFNKGESTSIFNILYQIGYRRAYFFDNFGNLCYNIGTDETDKIKEAYERLSSGEIDLYDIAIFADKHEEIIKDLDWA